MSRKSEEIDTNNLISLLDRAKERLLEQKNSELYESLEKKSSINEKPIKQSTDEFDLSNLSLNSSNEKASVYLLDQIAEIKDLFKTQEQLIGNFQPEDDTASNKMQELKDSLLRLTKDDKLSLDQDNAVALGNPDIEGSLFASTLLGFNSKTENQSHKTSSLPLLRFLRKVKKLSFSQKVFINSFLQSLNL